MPVKSKKHTTKRSEDEDVKSIDVQYNPEIVANLLKELKAHTESKCSQIQRDADFMITSMRQAFHLELIKLPTQVKQMSLKRFKDEFGLSLDAVTRGVIAGHERSPIEKGLMTPASKHPINYAHARNPREGETILSTNGSPLGSFSTVKKPLRSQAEMVPATPGVFVPMRNGDILDLDAVDVDDMSTEMKQDTLIQMQMVMENMQNLMQKLKAKV